MGLFGLSNPWDDSVEKATSENRLSEDWGTILGVCDTITNSNDKKDALKSIMKRVNHSNQRIATQGVILLDACVKNCGTSFREQVCQKDCTDAIQKLCSDNGPVSEKLRDSIARWIIDYKTEMTMIASVYYLLQSKGVVFPDLEETDKRLQEKTKASTDNNFVTDQQEADDIAQAIQLSMQQAQSQKTITEIPSLDQLRVNFDAQTAPNTSKQVPIYAKALYDFEAVEDNEVTFKTGDKLQITDSSHESWWKGKNLRTNSLGLFPMNFVTLTEKDSPEHSESTDDQNPTQSTSQCQKLIIPLDLERVEETLDQLRILDPTSEPAQTLLFNEKLCQAMTPSITEKVHALDEKFTEISLINEKFQNIMRSFDPNVQYGQGIANTQPYPSAPPQTPSPANSQMYSQNKLPNQFQ